VRSEQFSSGDHLAFGLDQPGEIVCQCNPGALHRTDVQIEGIKNNSATLALPCSWSRCSEAPIGSIGQIPSLYTQVYQPVALVGIASRAAQLMDIDDAMAMDSLKTSMVSDQTTQGC